MPATRITPSLLDRLVGDSLGDDAYDPTLGVTIAAAKASVARDIEDVLNVRASYSFAGLTEYPFAAQSYLTLGIRDSSSMSLAGKRDQQELEDSIRHTLERHDRRLTNVRVDVRTDRVVAKGLNFSINATLQLEPGAEAAKFDVTMEPGSSRWTVDGYVERRNWDMKPTTTGQAAEVRQPVNPTRPVQSQGTNG